MRILTPKSLKLPFNSKEESEKTHEALSINFFISSRTDKTEKKRIKLSGFAFLDYLFDHPYFVYNNYIPSWQRSSFFPASVFPVGRNKFQNTNPSMFSSPEVFWPRQRYFNKACCLKAMVSSWKGDYRGESYTESFGSFKRPLNDNLISEKRWPFLQNQTNFDNLRGKVGSDVFYTNKNLENKENYPPYFTTNDTLLKTLTWRFLKKIKHTRFSKIWRYSPLRIEPPLQLYSLLSDFNYKKPISFPTISLPRMISSNEILREKFIHHFANPPSQAPNVSHLANVWSRTQNQNNRSALTGRILKKDQHVSSLYDKEYKESDKTISSNRWLASLVSILNTTNFRDVLFERFMNAKFYDIGLMGRKRLNKKLRLNIPLQCTTLTPLDFLAIFYKLFSLYKCDSLLNNLKPPRGVGRGSVKPFRFPGSPNSPPTPKGVCPISVTGSVIYSALRCHITRPRIP